MRLKSTFLPIFALILAATIANAQNDSIPGAVLLPRQSDLDVEMDYLLGPKVPARWMLYAGREVNNNIEERSLWFTTFNNVTNVGFYYKIAPTIAVGTSINSAGGGIHVKLYQRWFFDMRERIREDRGANNFSGQYIGLSEEIATLLRSGFSAKNDFRPRFQLYYGIQHRFYQYILMDFSLGFSSNALLPKKRKEPVFFTFTPNFSLSGALFPYTAQKGARQHLRPRFHEQQRIFKVDLLGLLRRYWYNTSTYRFNVREISPYMALEQKWGHLPISTELGIRVVFRESRTSINGNKTADNVLQSIYSLETRWFYNQTPKIAAGKAGDNLTGPFVALHHQHERGRFSEILFGSSAQSCIHYHRTFLILGYQQRFFKRFFAQLKLGAGREVHQIFREEGIYKYVNRQVYSEVRAGVSF